MNKWTWKTKSVKVKHGIKGKGKKSSLKKWTYWVLQGKEKLGKYEKSHHDSVKRCYNNDNENDNNNFVYWLIIVSLLPSEFAYNWEMERKKSWIKNVEFSLYSDNYLYNVITLMNRMK